MHLTVETIRYEISLLQNPLHEFDPARHRGWCDESRQVIYISAREPVNQREMILRHEAIHAFEFAFGPPADDLESRATWMATVSRSIERQIGRQGGWARLMALPPDDVDEAAPEPVDEPPAVEEPVEAPTAQKSATGPGKTLDDMAILSQWSRRAETMRPQVPRPSGGRHHEPTPGARDIAAPPSTLFLGNRYCECGSGAIPSMIFNEPPELSPVFGCKVRRTLHCAWCRHLMSWVEAATPDGKPGGETLQLEPTFTRGKEMEAWLAKHPEIRAVDQ